MHRSWAIETGIVEGRYRLDEAQTRTHIHLGFKSAIIPRSGTGQNSENLLAVLQDHMATLEAICGEVRDGRSISRSATPGRPRASPRER